MPLKRMLKLHNVPSCKEFATSFLPKIKNKHLFLTITRPVEGGVCGLLELGSWIVGDGGRC